jgi:FkbH-like protein
VDRKLSAALCSHLEALDLLASVEFLHGLQEHRASLEAIPSGALLLAQLAEISGERKESIRLLLRLDEGSNLNGAILLDLVRLLTREGLHEEACACLRRVALASRDFTILSRAAKQLLQLKQHAPRFCTRTLRLAVLYPYTTDLWIPLLRLGLFREGIWADIHVPPYGTQEQSILDPASPLFTFDPELVILAPTWRDLNLPAFSASPSQVINDRVAEVVQRWKHIQALLPARIIQHNFEVPATDPNGQLGHVMPGGRASIIRQINDRLFLEAQTHHVSILNLDQLASNFGKNAWSDASYWHTAKQYPAPSGLPALVDGLVARIRAGLGLTKKVLVLDLDNTLWGGVIGEDGLKGIQIGPPSATGEAHLALQRYAAQLKERGILLAVCSKNNEPDAKAPFLEHEAMHLHLDDIVLFIANWQDKPGNLRTIAKTLNLGLDSLVFLDDNPTERALVRQELPQVSVPEIGSDPARYVEILDAACYFDADWLSPEDLERNRNYINNIERESLRSTATSMESFLEGLNMSCEHASFDDQVLPRIVQLLGKTNQFNLTTRRHSELQIRNIMTDPRAWTQYFRLKDKFDDNGLVGVQIAVPSAIDPNSWEVDTWLMSCRVIGRQLENFMFNTLISAGRERNIDTIHGNYIPTAKNDMVANLYLDLGFSEIHSHAPGSRIYRISPKEAKFLPATFILDLPR